MTDTIVSAEEFQRLVQPLLELPVSLAGKGYGSAVFFELGPMVPLDASRRRPSHGEACISIRWDWRVEADGEVLFGSSNSRPEIEAGVATVERATVRNVSVAGQVPELSVEFSNGLCLRSMVMVTGDPEWSIRLPGRRWIHASGGRLHVSTGDAGEGSISDEERAAFDLAERAAARWGTPIIEPAPGACDDCAFFVPLDGEGDLLDYGGCMAESGPFDGRIVRADSGCPSFRSREER